MIKLPERCVIDASVGIKLFLDEEHSAQVQAMLESRVADPDDKLLVPDLFFIECANVLWKRVRRWEYPEEMARRNLSDLRRLALYATPTRDLAERALEIACSHGITTYDACYVALSEVARAPLFTADVRLRDRLANQFNVLLLGE